MDVDNQDQGDPEALFDEIADNEQPGGGSLADRLTKPRESESTGDLREDEEVEIDLPPVEAKKETQQPVKDPDDEVDLKALARAVSRISSGLDGLHGRFGNVSQKLESLEKERAAKQTAGSEQPSKTQVENAAAALVNDDPEWNSFKDEFPQMAKAIEKRFAPALAALQQQPKEVVKEVVQPDPRIDDLLAQQKQYEIERQTNLLREAHPDFQEVAASQKFQTYLAGLPPKVAELNKSYDASEVSYLLSLFKKDTGWGQPATPVDSDKERRLRNAVAPSRGQAQGRRTVVSEDEMDPEQLFEHLARQDERRPARR